MLTAYTTTGDPHLNVFINGRFLSQPLTGVQRYAAEMVRAIDKLLFEGKAPAALANHSWRLLTPADTTSVLDLKVITTQQVGRNRGHLWDQLDLARAGRAGKLLSFANSGPVAHGDHLVVIHDAQVFRRPDFFSRSYVMLHSALGRILARTARIATVSRFSQRELADVLKLPLALIDVFPNSAEHFSLTVPDHSIIAELGLTPGKFFLGVGTLTRNKNLQLAVDALGLLQRPSIPLVIVGGDNRRVFRGAIESPKNGVIMAGRLRDAQIAALYSSATAFLFPSHYEGFGVPPLEAMSFGCPVIASNAGAVRETCGDAVTYFDPNDATELSECMQQRLALGSISPEERARQRECLARYSWTRSAERLLQSIGASCSRR